MKGLLQLLIIIGIFALIIWGGVSYILSFDSVEQRKLIIVIGSIILAYILLKFFDIISNSEYPVVTTTGTILNKTTRKITKNFDGYYITFELDSKERLEFKVSESVYGIFLEGDKGNLVYQGTRFISFERLTD